MYTRAQSKEREAKILEEKEAKILKKFMETQKNEKKTKQELHKIYQESPVKTIRNSRY